MRRLLLGLFLALAPSCAAFAQVFVSPSPSRGDAGVNVASVSPAEDASQSAATLTITPPGGQFVYITGIQLAACLDGTASITSANASWTTTNLNGLTFQTSVISGSTITTAPGASLCDRIFLPLTTPLKSVAAGTAVTLVPPATVNHVAFPSVVTYYTAP